MFLRSYLRDHILEISRDIPKSRKLCKGWGFQMVFNSKFTSKSLNCRLEQLELKLSTVMVAIIAIGLRHAMCQWPSEANRYYVRISSCGK